MWNRVSGHICFRIISCSRVSADTPGSHFSSNIRMMKAVSFFVGNTCHASHRGSEVGAVRPEPDPVQTVDTKFFQEIFPALAAFRHADRMAVYGQTLPCWIKLLVLLKLPDCRMSPPCFSQIPAQLCMLPCPFPSFLRFLFLRSSFIIFRPSCADTRIYAVLLSALAFFIKQRFLQFYSIPHFAFLLTTYKP